MEHHRGKIGFFAEFLARKYDRFGWDKMDAQIRLAIRLGYMDKLQNFPMEEIKEACEVCELQNTKRAPTDIEILKQIRADRDRKARIIAAKRPVKQEPPRPAPMSEVDAARVLADAGFTPRRFDAAKQNRMAVTWEQMEAQPARKEMDRESYMTAAEIAAEDRRAAG